MYQSIQAEYKLRPVNLVQIFESFMFRWFTKKWQKQLSRAEVTCMGMLDWIIIEEIRFSETFVYSTYEIGHEGRPHCV